MGIAVAASLHTAAVAQTALPPVFIYSEADSPKHIACRLTNEAAASAAEARLRHNQVPIAKEQELYAHQAIALYLNLNVIQLSSGICAAALNLDLKTHAPVRHPVTAKMRFAEIVFCNKGVLITRASGNNEEALTHEVERLIDICVIEYGRSTEE